MQLEESKWIPDPQLPPDDETKLLDNEGLAK